MKIRRHVSVMLSRDNLRLANYACSTPCIIDYREISRGSVASLHIYSSAKVAAGGIEEKRDEKNRSGASRD